jgi:hypothetical protein
MATSTYERVLQEASALPPDELDRLLDTLEHLRRKYADIAADQVNAGAGSILGRAMGDTEWKAANYIGDPAYGSGAALVTYLLTTEPLDPAGLDEMERAIEEDCERIDPRDW